ncbi:MAG: hypothetical protein ACO27F_14260 [Beijerinckiaceae bacterium]
MRNIDATPSASRHHGACVLIFRQTLRSHSHDEGKDSFTLLGREGKQVLNHSAKKLGARASVGAKKPVFSKASAKGLGFA